MLIKEGMVKGFMALDEEMHEFQGLERGGTTAICVIVTPEYLFFANLGKIFWSSVTNYTFIFLLDF